MTINNAELIRRVIREQFLLLTAEDMLRLTVPRYTPEEVEYIFSDNNQDHILNRINLITNMSVVDGKASRSTTE